jgi:hypothetical protein
MSLMGYTTDEVDEMVSAIQKAIAVLNLNIDFIVVPNKKEVVARLYQTIDFFDGLVEEGRV